MTLCLGSLNLKCDSFVVLGEQMLDKNFFYVGVWLYVVSLDLDFLYVSGLDLRAHTGLSYLDNIANVLMPTESTAPVSVSSCSKSASLELLRKESLSVALLMLLCVQCVWKVIRAW